MIDLYTYCDYRAYLKDVFKAHQERSPHFTFRYFTDRAGLASSATLKLVMEGDRHLSEESLQGVSKALKHNTKEQRYFQLLLKFAKAKSIEEKGELLQKMDVFRSKNSPVALDNLETEYLSKWYHCVIREMVDLPCFVESPEWIAEQLKFQVKPIWVKESLEYLESAHFIKRENGRLSRTTKTLSTGTIQDQSRVQTIARLFHVKMFENALKSIEKDSKIERFVSNTTLSLSQSSYDKIIQRVQQMRLEVLEIVAADASPDQIYQLSLCIFPTTQRIEL